MKKIKFQFRKTYLSIYSRYLETKKNFDLFNRLFFKNNEKLKRIIYSLIYAEQPKFLEHELKTFGSKNTEINFFVIRLTLGGGIFSNYNNVLYLLKYAEEFIFNSDLWGETPNKYPEFSNILRKKILFFKKIFL